MGAVSSLELVARFKKIEEKATCVKTVKNYTRRLRNK